MHQTISPKIVALTFGILVILFTIGFYVVAWQEPGFAPPSGNVAAPLNTGVVSQTKAGALTIAAGGGDALILRNGGDLRLYNAANSGSASFYVDNNGEMITPGKLKVGNTLIKNDGTISTNLNSDKLDNYHAADLLAQAGGGGGVLITWGYTYGSSPGAGAPACPSGWTEAYAGFGPYGIAYSDIIYNSLAAFGYAAVSTNCGLSGTLYGTGNNNLSACGLASGYNYCNTCRVCVK